MKKFYALVLIFALVLTGAVMASDDGQPQNLVKSDALGTGNSSRDPGSLTTHFSGGNGYAGNMFDITPLLEMEITAIDIHQDFAGAQSDVDVWYRVGTCVGHESSSVGWTLIGSFTGTGAGLYSPTYIDMTGNGVVFEASKTYGIYVDLTNYLAGVSRLSYTNATPTMYSNAELSLLTHCGKAVGGFTASTFFDREWNGTVYYNTLGMDLPRVDITCNGEDAGVVVPSGANAKLEFDVHAGLGAGYSVDIWVAMRSPYGFFSYDSIGPYSGWNSGLGNCYFSGALYDLTEIAYDGILPAGSYDAYVAIDTVMNGILDRDKIYTYDVVDFDVQ